jgi:hypothetical protein
MEFLLDLVKYCNHFLSSLYTLDRELVKREEVMHKVVSLD